MKSVLVLTAMLSVSTFVNAQVKEGVVSSRTRITCYTDAEYLREVIGEAKNKGQKDKEVVKHKTSEAIRITWKEGDIENRFSDFKGFDESGKVIQIGKNFAKYQAKLEGNILTETNEATGASQFLNDDTYEDDKKMRNYSVKTVTVSEINGEKRTVKQSTVNGVEDLSAIGSVAMSLKAGDKHVETSVAKTPYVKQSKHFRTTVLKEELSCLHESLPN